VNTLYDSDFYAWTQEQAKLLRQQKVGISRQNLIEEIDFGQTRTKGAKESSWDSAGTVAVST